MWQRRPQLQNVSDARKDEEGHQGYNQLCQLHVEGVILFYAELQPVCTATLLSVCSSSRSDAAQLTVVSLQETSQISKPLPQNNTFPGDPADAFMSVDAHLGMLPTDIPDSARASVGAAFPDPTLSMDGIQPSPVMSGGCVKPENQFGSGLMMTPVDDDPLYLGPIKPDYIFPLPSSVEDAVQLAWTASYRCAFCPASEHSTTTAPKPASICMWASNTQIMQHPVNACGWHDLG